MFDSNLNNAELTIARKYDGDMAAKKALFWILWIGIPVAIFVVAGILDLMLLALILAVALLVVIGPIFKFTKKFIVIDYEYIIAIGDFTVNIINGKNSEKRHEWFSFKVSTAEMIAPYRDEYKKQADECGATVTYMAASSIINPSPDLYFAVFEDVSGQKAIMYFEPSEKVLKVLKRLNDKTVVVDVAR